MNLNAFLCRFPTVFGKYIRILDHVSKIRRFHSMLFEFQGFENRPQICFLSFRILYCKPILGALSLLVCGLQNVQRNCNAIKITHFFGRFSTGFDVLTTNKSPLDPVLFWVVFNRCSVLFIKTTYSREPWHCGVQGEEKNCACICLIPQQITSK